MNLKYLLIATLAVAACSDDKKDESENIVRAPELQSEWKGACEDAGLLSLSATTSFNFESLNFTRVLYGSTDGSCATQDLVISYKGEYSVPAASDAQKEIGAQPIDLSYKTVLVKPMTAGTRDLLNATNFCSHNNWEVNVEKDITANSAETGCLVLDLPQMQYDIFSTEGGILRFGETGIAKQAPNVPEQRPTAFNGISLNK